MGNGKSQEWGNIRRSLTERNLCSVLQGNLNPVTPESLQWGQGSPVPTSSVMVEGESLYLGRADAGGWAVGVQGRSSEIHEVMCRGLTAALPIVVCQLWFPD